MQEIHQQQTNQHRPPEGCDKHAACFDCACLSAVIVQLDMGGAFTKSKDSSADLAQSGQMQARRRLSLYDATFSLAASRSATEDRIVGGGGIEPDDGRIPGGKSAAACLVSWGSCSRPGNDPMRPERENQDCFVVEDRFGDNDGQLFCSVLDGHGPQGTRTALFVRDAIAEQCLERKGRLKLEQEVVIQEAHKDADRHLHEESGLDLYVSGTSALTVLYQTAEAASIAAATTHSIGTLWVANVGDGRIVLARMTQPPSPDCERPELEAVELSQDHTADRCDEAVRIIASGGRIFEWGVPRVWLRDVDMPGLAMTRSFGDDAASTVGVCCEPEITEHHISACDCFAVVATDGVWAFIASDECVRLVAAALDEDGADPQSACDALVAEAVRRWERDEDVVDDITAVLLVFGNKGHRTYSTSAGGTLALEEAAADDSIEVVDHGEGAQKGQGLHG